MRYVFAILLCITTVFLLQRKDKFLNYPYAENNTISESYYGHTIKDDYKWLEGEEESNNSIKKWIESELDLSDQYFKKRGSSIFQRIEDLCKFERYSLIRSSNSSLYFCGLKPFNNEIIIYKYDPDSHKNHLKKKIKLPFQPEQELNALVLQDEKHIAIAGGRKGESNKLYIYDLSDHSSEPVKTINNIVNRPFNPTNSGFLFITDNLSSDNETSGVNSLYHCSFNENDVSIKLECIYTDERYSLNYSFESSFDSNSNNVYLGAYEDDSSGVFTIQSINLKTKEKSIFKRIQGNNKEELRLGGADDVNLYILGTDKKYRGSLYIINKNTLKTDTILNNNALPVQDFSLSGQHAIIYFQGHKANRAYLINKHTKTVDELPIDDNYFYRFYRNKKNSRIYYQKESLTTPREIYSVDLAELAKTKRVNNRTYLPFNPDDYTKECITIKSESGSDINMLITYKKGIIRDGANPLILCALLNSEESFLDKFYLSRVLYMDQGYIFVQRARSDNSKTVILEHRISDIYRSIQYLINEKYTSPDKVAIFGKEYGATAAMQLLNKYKDIKAPVILMDGVYDLIKYNNNGRLLYNNKRLLHASNAETFGKLLDISPYHNVNIMKNYPPILLMSSNENMYISKAHTYKMTAKLQMRTRGFNPIVMLTPNRIDRLEEYDHYIYTMFIEHAFWFVSKNLGVQIN